MVYNKGIGKLATDRYDFEDHVRGNKFKHKAADITLNPSVMGKTDVQSSLASIQNWISLQTSKTDGFVTVGDNCNIYQGGLLNLNVFSLDEILNPAFDAILNGNPAPAGFERVSKGGIVVIKAGTYLVKRTIKVPPGIILMGEGFGTKIVNATGLDLLSAGSNGIPTKGSISIDTIGFFPPTSPTSSDGYVKVKLNNPISDFDIRDGDSVFISINPPTIGGSIYGVSFDDPVVVSVGSSLGIDEFLCYVGDYNGLLHSWSGGNLITSSSVFSIEKDTLRVDLDGSIDSDKFIFNRETVICNMVISDNLVEPSAGVSDNLYKEPQNIYSFLPLIAQRAGSNLTIEKVKLIGKTHGSSGKTFRAVSLVDRSLIDPSILTISNCFIDGFRSPIDFEGLCGKDDTIRVINNQIRCYGNTISLQPNEFSAISINDNTAIIVDNVFYAKSNALAFVSVQGTQSSYPPDKHNRARISVQNNSSRIDPSIIGFNTFYVNSTISNPKNYFSALISGNVFEDTFEIFDADSGTNPLFSYSSTSSQNILNLGSPGSISRNLININGETIINGEATINGDMRAYGSIYAFGGDLTVDGASYLKDDLTVDGIASLKDSLTVDGFLWAKNNLEVTGTTTTHNIYSVGNSSVTGTLSVNQEIYGHSDVQVDGNLIARNDVFLGTNLTNKLEVSGDAKINGDTEIVGDAKVGKDLFVDGMVDVTQDLYIGGSSYVDKDIYLDGYLSTNKDLSTYTEPDSDTWMHLKFDEIEGSTVFENTGSSKINIPNLQVITPTTKIQNSSMRSVSYGGLFGNALFSDGKGPVLSDGWSHVRTPDSYSFVDNPGNEITISCWVNIHAYHIDYDNEDYYIGKSLPGGKQHSFVHKKIYRNSIWGSDPVSFEIGTNNAVGLKRGAWFIRVGLVSGSGTLFSTTATASADGYRIPLNTWCLLTMTYSYSQGKLCGYFNGKKFVESNVGNFPICYSDGYYCIGYPGYLNSSDINQFKSTPGLIDDVRIESTVRSESYIKGMYDRAGIDPIYFDRSEISRVSCSNSTYEKKYRFYAEDIGHHTLVHNASWNPSIKKWEQDNKSSPSSLLWSGTFTRHEPIFYGKPVLNNQDVISNGSTIGICSKSPNSSPWNNIWESYSILETGTITDKFDSTLSSNFSRLSLGPSNNDSPGFGFIELNGNRKAGTLDNVTGGPYLKISGPNPLQKVKLNSLYSANIPKAFAAFKFSSTLGGVTVGNNLVSQKDTYVKNSFNIASVHVELCELLPPPLASGWNVFKIKLVNAISNMVAFASIDLNMQNSLSNLVSYHFTWDYSPRYRYIDDNTIEIWIINTGYPDQNPVDPYTTLSQFQDLYINIMVFGDQ